MVACSDSRAAAWHSAQPACQKVPSEDKVDTAASSTAHHALQDSKGSCSCDFVMLESHHSEGGWGEEKSPSDKCLLPQHPKQNSQQKGMSSEVSACATENSSQEKHGESSGQQEQWCNKQLHWTWHQDPPHANAAGKGQVSWGPTACYYLFSSFSCAVRKLRQYSCDLQESLYSTQKGTPQINWVKSFSTEWTLHWALLGRSISVLVFAAKLNSVFSLETVLSSHSCFTNSIRNLLGLWLPLLCQTFPLSYAATEKHYLVTPFFLLFQKRAFPLFFCYYFEESYFFEKIISTGDETTKWKGRGRKKKRNSLFSPISPLV